ncbi:hypothetical protein RUM44_011585 [Polyplax serrata]|uniref:Uncharacterized protein n=1 Tax=Polyplax serrata TaxID=468196 RepID=A0ABR1AQI7_POLSC
MVEGGKKYLEEEEDRDKEEDEDGKNEEEEKNMSKMMMVVGLSKKPGAKHKDEVIMRKPQADAVQADQSVYDNASCDTAMKNAEGVTNRRQNLQGHKKHLLKKSPSSAYHKQQATAFDNS